MNKQVKQLMIIAVLIPILGFILMGNFKKKSTKKNIPGAKKPAAEAAGKSPGVSAPIIPADKNKLSTQKERANLPWGRDVFMAPTDKEYQRSDLNLKGISFGADKMGFAFINNDIVKVGDKVGDYEVLVIEKDKVLVGKGAQSFYLTLPQE